jgi:hypothetical protein
MIRLRSASGVPGGSGIPQTRWARSRPRLPGRKYFGLLSAFASNAGSPRQSRPQRCRTTINTMAQADAARAPIVSGIVRTLFSQRDQGRKSSPLLDLLASWVAPRVALEEQRLTDDGGNRGLLVRFRNQEGRLRPFASEKALRMSANKDDRDFE